MINTYYCGYAVSDGKLIVGYLYFRNGDAYIIDINSLNIDEYDSYTHTHAVEGFGIKVVNPQSIEVREA